MWMISPEDQHFFKMLIRKERKEKIVSIAHASAAMEFESFSREHYRALLEAVDKGERRDPLYVDDVLGWHRSLFPFGGSLRTSTAYVTGMAMEIPPPSWSAFYNWVEGVNWWCEQPPDFLGLAITHLDFERMHPFTDGNGRVGRIAVNYMASRMGLGLICLTDRHQYLDALESNSPARVAQLFRTCRMA